MTQEAALDKEYHYGVSAPGSFGAEANLQSAKDVLEALEKGIDDVEKIADISHEAWAKIARTFDDPVYKTKPEKKEQRAKLAAIPYKDLPEDEKEKDRVAARALIKAYKKHKNGDDDVE